MHKGMLRSNCKWILTVIMVIGIGISLGLALKNYQTEQPYMFYETNEHNFGTLAPKTKIRHSFDFSNLGNRPLMIKDVKVSCGCTFAEADKTLILPDESASLNLQYIASQHRKQAEYYISVITNEPQNHIHRFCIRANIVPRIEIEPETIRFGQVNDEKLPIRKLITIRTENRENIHVRTDSSFLNTQLERIDERNHRLFVEIRRGAPRGPLSSRIYFDLKGDNPLSLQSPVLGHVIGEIRAEPASVFFGVVKNQGTAEKTVVLRGQEEGEITIDRYQLSQSLNTDISVTIEGGSPSPLLKVRLKPQDVEKGRRRPQKREGFIRLWVRLDTNSSATPGRDEEIRGFRSCELNIPVVFFLANIES